MVKMENGRRRIIDVYATRTWKQRNSLVKIIDGIFVLTTLSLCTVSCNTVSIVSGFEKQTLRQGDNFTLECRATGFYHVTMTWLLDGLPLEYSTPEPPESIRLKADNPHSNPDVPKQEDSRYLIKNSNKFSTDSDDGGALIPQGIKDPENRTGSNDSAAERIPTHQNRVLDPSYREPPPIIPANIVLSEDRMVTVTSVLSLNNASVSDGGMYTCVARDVTGETARWSRKIAVAGTLSLRQNRPIFGLIDSVVIILCTVLGTGENLPVQWFYQKFPSSNDGENPWITLPDDHRQTVHDDGSFEIRDARKNNEGVYICQVDLKGNLTNMSTPLKVMVPPKIKPFKFAQVKVGKTFADFCLVLEGDLPLDVSWYKDNVLLRPSEKIEMHRSGERALSLTISSASLSSAGYYSCCAKNNVSQTCTVSELVVLDPPTILGLPLQVTAISENDVVIPCRATGFPKPNVTWMRVVDDSKRDYVLVPRVKGSDESHRKKFPRVYQTKNGSLVISNVSSSAHGGKYLCRAQNKVDELSRFVTLQVHNPARVTELTGTRDVVYRSGVTIECASWGDDDVAVQWFKNGKAVKTSGRYIGATVPNYSFIETHSVSLERLLITNTTRADAGLYTCIASNTYGTSSKDIDILVRAPPSVPGKFEVIDKGTSFLRMVISPGDDDGGSKLLSYEVTRTKIVEEIFPTPPEHARRITTPAAQEVQQRLTIVKYPASATSTDQEIVLDELECGANYEMTVRAVNEIGQSFEALNLTAKTIGTVPMMLEANDLVVDENQTAVVLDLRAWQNGGCPITALMLEYARHGDTEWNLTHIDSGVLEKALFPQGENGDKSGQNPAHVVISDLETGTWYKICSYACNNAGCNYVTHSVPTLRADGSTVPPMKTEVEKEAAENDDARFLVPMVCGFGLVLLLVLLLLFYRHKQRSKKLMRMTEARKMANKLLYKTEDRSSSILTGGMRVEFPEEGERNGSDTGDTAGDVQVETSVSCAEEEDTSSVGLQMTTSQDDNTVTATYYEDAAHIQSDTFSNLAGDHAPAACGSHNNSNNSSTNSKRSDGKKSLRDNAELAVFRGTASSDEEDHATEPLVCDESAFGDSGTWSYFQPGSRARPPKKYAAIPTIETNHVPRRLSSSSSGTDEELAQVFGLTSSKQKFKPVLEKEILKSDLNENYRCDSKKLSKNQNPPTKIVKQGPKINSIKSENYYAIGEQERANSTGMVQKTDPRFFKALPGDALRHHRRSDFNNVEPRPTNPNTNPFKSGFRPTQQAPVNFHRPHNAHTRGHTYSNGTPSNWNGQFPSSAQFGDPRNNSSPYGERRWVDTYDSRSSVNRSKPPSWGSTDLDKHGFYTPPSINTAVANRARQREASHTPEIGPEHDDRTYPCTTKEHQKLDTNSPRDSGIGSDEVPGSRHMTSSVSPPHMKSRNVLKSLESLDEVECRKGDRSSSCSVANAPNASSGKDCIFSMSPPLTPPVNQTKLAPHIFVDISSKCNTTPTRTSRSSYPPASSHCRLAPPKKLDYLPTPPPSGPTSPEEPNFSRSRKRRGNERWCVADLDGLAKYQPDSDSRLAGDNDITSKKKAANLRNNSDTMYSVSKDERTWQASTLV